MAVIKSGASTDQLTVDATSKAARVTPYDAAGLAQCGVQTYVAAVTATASAAGTGVLFNIKGSATKTVRVSRIRINATVATTVIIAAFLLAKRTVAGAGGTAVVITPVSADSNNTAATATANLFSALATAGTGGGIIDIKSMLVPIVSSTTADAGAAGGQTIDFIAPIGLDGRMQPWVLRGVAESLEVSTLATVTNTPTYAISAFFTEE